MKIKKGSNLLTLESQKGKLALMIGPKANVDDLDFVIPFDREVETPKGNYYIKAPGEFERNDVFVYAYATEQEGMIYSIDVDNVNVLLMNSDVKGISKETYNSLDNINAVLCVVKGEDYSILSEVIDNVEPNVLMLTGSDELYIENLVKKLSLNVSESVSSIQLSEDDFLEDMTSAIRTIILK